MADGFCFLVSGLGRRVYGLELRVGDSEFRVQGSGYRVWGLGLGSQFIINLKTKCKLNVMSKKMEEY